MVTFMLAALFLILPSLIAAIDAAPQLENLLAQGRAAEVAGTGMHLLERAPADPALLEVTGRAFLALRRPADAAALFRRELAVSPLSIQPVRSLAQTYLAANDFPNAEIFLSRLTVADPADPLNWYRLGQLLYRQGYYDGSRGNMERALQLSGLALAERVEARRIIAICLVESGHYSEAEPALAAAESDLQNKPNLDLLLSSARLFYETNRFPEALKQADRALAADVRNAAAHLWRGRILLRQNQSSEALAEIERARDLAPDSPAPRNLLVRLYQKLGRPVDAAREADWLHVHEAQ